MRKLLFVALGAAASLCGAPLRTVWLSQQIVYQVGPLPYTVLELISAPPAGVELPPPTLNFEITAKYISQRFDRTLDPLPIPRGAKLEFAGMAVDMFGWPERVEYSVTVDPYLPVEECLKAQSACEPTASQVPIPPPFLWQDAYVYFQVNNELWASVATGSFRRLMNSVSYLADLPLEIRPEVITYLRQPTPVIGFYEAAWGNPDMGSASLGTNSITTIRSTWLIDTRVVVTQTVAYLVPVPEPSSALLAAPVILFLAAAYRRRTRIR
jgi:hypothetical protein